MKLLYQTHSPFARKVLVFAHEAGLASRIEVVHHETSPTLRNEHVYAQNPLGKVPVLLRPGALPLFDSDVICAWLDTLNPGRKLIPADGEARWLALRLQAVAQGLAETGIAYRWETVRRPIGLRYEALKDGLHGKLIATYSWLEAEADLEAGILGRPAIDRFHLDSPVHVGHIAIATTLSWIEFRSLPDFREGRPRLSAWLDRFAQRPSMLSTPLSGETLDGPASNS
jgi:glutathione S-transferase